MPLHRLLLLAALPALSQTTKVGVALGNLSSALGLTQSVELHVYDKVVANAEAAFRERGITSDVSHGTYQIPESKGVADLRNGNWERGVVPAGQYQLVHIHVRNPVGIAKAEKGAALVGIAMATGMADIEKEVQKKVESEVYETLKQAGVQAIFVRLKKAQTDGQVKLIEH